MTNQTENNSENYLVDPTFTKVNRLVVLSFEKENDRTSFSKYYIPNIQRKDFLDMQIKDGEKTYEQIIEMGRNNNYMTTIY